MKILLGLSLLLLTVTSCGKKDNRRSGVCYCTFVKGGPQEYDLTSLTRQQQIDTCNNHSKNAGYFGGKCELK